jgi:hypothetical protein
VVNFTPERQEGRVDLHYGAGASEALFCENEHVFVVGGGNSAGQTALHFCRYTSKVTMVVREDLLKQTMSEYLIDRIRGEPKIEVLLNTVVTALHGERVLRAITLKNTRTGAEWIAETSRLFLCLGGVPHTQWAEEVGIVRDDGGYLVTGSDLLKKGERPKNWKLDRSPLLHGNEHTRRVRRRRRAAWLGQALRFCRRRRRNDGNFRSPISRERVSRAHNEAVSL